MINVDMERLTELEKRIHKTILEASKTDKKLTVNKAAELSGCSMSKITKFIQKTGFQSFKQYMGLVYGSNNPQKQSSNEIQRIKSFLDNFNTSLVDEFISLIRSHKKIILFGYGPTLICMQYFEYKLRIVTNNVVIAVPDETTAARMLDELSLFVIFSTTGQFRSFKSIYEHAKHMGSKALLVVEEYNTSLLGECDKIMYLTQSFQDMNLRPYDKSRSVFFIFIEEVVRRLLEEDGKNFG
ncbi:MAG: SIS domain-containing protein [Defluviitaleaceae bacterium]|nr:SIS domain-containing protein [Defluviitaleaceae bacterium]